MPSKLGLLIFAVVCVAAVECSWCIHAKILPRVTAKGEELRVEELHTLLDCKSWLEATNVDLWNAFSTRKGIEAPHYFLFKPAAGALMYYLSFCFNMLVLWRPMRAFLSDRAVSGTTGYIEVFAWGYCVCRQKLHRG